MEHRMRTATPLDAARGVALADPTNIQHCVYGAEWSRDRPGVGLRQVSPRPIEINEGSLNTQVPGAPLDTYGLAPRPSCLRRELKRTNQPTIGVCMHRCIYIFI